MRLTCLQLTKTCSAQGQEASPSSWLRRPFVTTLIAWNRLGEAVLMHCRLFACSEAKNSRDIENPTKSAVFAISTQG